MKSRTMRVEIGTPLYKAIIHSVQNSVPFALEGWVYSVVDAQRIERTDKVRFILNEVEI